MSRRKSSINKKVIKSERTHDPVKPIIAGIVGAAVGAGVGYAGVVAMRDKKNKSQND